MSKHQYRLWQNMIYATDDFLKGKLGFPVLVLKVEPPLDAAPVEDDKILTEWYTLWEPLEIINASDLDKGKETKLEDVKEKVDKMRDFLVRTADKVKQL